MSAGKVPTSEERMQRYSMTNPEPPMPDPERADCWCRGYGYFMNTAKEPPERTICGNCEAAKEKAEPPMPDVRQELVKSLRNLTDYMAKHDDSILRLEAEVTEHAADLIERLSTEPTAMQIGTGAALKALAERHAELERRLSTEPTGDDVSDDDIIGLINLVTDLADADALDRAIPEVREFLRIAAMPRTDEVERLRELVATMRRNIDNCPGTCGYDGHALEAALRSDQESA